MSAQDLDLICAAARSAGVLAREIRDAGLEKTSKSDGTPVTNADLAVDRALKSRLETARPTYGWLSEETADHPDARVGEALFIVDPIDGTRAFLKGQPWWTVSIAVVRAGRPTVAVVHAPDLEETFTALAGVGAALNGQPIHASDAAAVEDCAMLGDAPMFAHPAWPRPWPPMRIETRNSIAYRMCLVACGRFDAALALSAKSEWDLAAADLIATESGCRVTDHVGEALTYNRDPARAPSLVCAAPRLHPLILERTSPLDLNRPAARE